MPPVLDASALVAFLANEPAASDVERALNELECRISAINLAETADRLMRVGGRQEDRVQAALDTLASERLHVITVTAGDAWRAASVRRTHYHRKHSPLSLADCFAIAATRPGDVLLTSDRALGQAAEAEGLEVHALPDSKGKRA